MGILDQRLTYKPFEYDQAYKFWEAHELAFWLWNEAPFEGDEIDWLYNLTPREKSVVGSILKGFAQTECLVGSYWLRMSLRFPKPEIMQMCALFAEAEGRHAKAYNFLNEKLDLQEFDAFVQEPEVAHRIGNLLKITDNNPENIAISLAIYSGFCEGVSLFAAFAILIRFKMNNLLKATGKLVEYSLKDESVHSSAGCWLFRTFLAEYPELNREYIHEKVYEGAAYTLKLELDYIDFIFSQGDIPNLDSLDLKEYIKMRTNTKLLDLGLQSRFSYDEERCERINSWFGVMTVLPVQTDFFANAEANYSKRVLDLSNDDW